MLGLVGMCEEESAIRLWGARWIQGKVAHIFYHPLDKQKYYQVDKQPIRMSLH